MKEVKIPEEFYERFESRASEKGFDSAEEYIIDVLRQVYDKLEPEDFSEEEEEQVKEKLKDLGYM
ncbi:MAG: CopG family transcriptional regulator [Candidatus Nanohaloarchaea archaeon]